MAGRRASRFFRIAAIVHPVGALEIVLLAAIGHELPYAASPGSRNSLWLEGAFSLRQIDQILRNSFFL